MLRVSAGAWLVIMSLPFQLFRFSNRVMAPATHCVCLGSIRRCRSKLISSWLSTAEALGLGTTQLTTGDHRADLHIAPLTFAGLLQPGGQLRLAAASRGVRSPRSVERSLCRKGSRRRRLVGRVLPCDKAVNSGRSASATGL